MLSFIIGLILREVAVGIFRVLTKKDIEREIDKIDWLKDGLFHAIAKKLKPQFDRLSIIVRHEVETAKGFRHSTSLEQCDYNKCANL